MDLRFFMLCSAVGLFACSGEGELRSKGEGSDESRSAASGDGSRPDAADGTGAVQFADITRSSGIDFVHDTGFDENYWFPEIVGPGVALLDVDNDGLLDLFFVDGGCLTPGSDNLPEHRLYRNVGEGKFVDVTATSGIAASLSAGSEDGGGGASRIVGNGVPYGQGCAVADFDNDGFLDIYVTVVGANQLLRNQGDGTFVDIAAAAGVEGSKWSTSAAFADLDLDGDLDLYVTNYCLWSAAGQVPCQTPSGEPDYCNPKAFEPAPDVFYLNQGDGTFADASQQSGVVTSYGRGLGVLVADYDGDLDLDLYVANDGDPNILWLNQGDGTFLDEGLLSGSALNANGDTEASMGVAIADLEADGDWDLFLTHMTGETNTLYLNDGAGVFEDATDALLGAPSMPFTGFGTGFLDADLDGDEDLFIANGAVIKSADAARSPWPYAQRDQFFLASGERNLREIPFDAAPWLGPAAVSRGAAFGDIDNDGRADIVVANASGPPRVLRNETTLPGHWLGIDLEQTGGNREALGARVFVEQPAEGTRRMKRVARDGGFASSNDPRVVFGLPDPETQEVRVAVEWPGGEVEFWRFATLDQYHTLTRGEGTPGKLNEFASAGDLPLDTAISPNSTTDLTPARSSEPPALPSLDTVDPKVAARVREAYEALSQDRENAGLWKEYGLALFADVGDDAKAKLALEQAVLRAPDDVRSVYLLAILEERLGEPERMRIYLERAESLDQSYLPIQLRLAGLDVDAGQLDPAQVRYERALSAQPNDYDALEGLGRVHRLSGNSAAALTRLREAVEVAPGSRGAHYELGLALRGVGEANAARAALERASALTQASLRDPWLDELYAGRGGDRGLLTKANQARKAGNLQAASVLFEEYAEARPEDPIGWVNAAAVRRDLGQLDLAVVAVEKALALTPDDARSLALKGSILLQQKRPSAALPLFVRATETDPSLSPAWYDRYTVETQMRDLPAARKSLETYLELRPNDGASFFRLGEIAIRSSDISGARAAYEKAVQVDSKQASAFYRLGGLSLQASEHAAAVGYFSKAVEIRPDWVEAYLGLGHAYRGAGNISEARSSLQRGLTLSPNAARIQALLEKLPEQ